MRLVASQAQYGASAGQPSRGGICSTRNSNSGAHSTFYAHLSGFAPRVAKGARVAQGDVIGYVGRSGLAVDLALRAVRKCEPYKLPEDSYEQWKDIVVTIGPAKG